MSLAVLHKKKKNSLELSRDAPALSDRTNDRGWSARNAKWVQKCTLVENALYMTRTRRERESACFVKRVCWCSLAFLINFILTLHPRCISQLPKLFSKRTTGRDAPHQMARWQSLLTGTIYSQWRACSTCVCMRFCSYLASSLRKKRGCFGLTLFSWAHNSVHKMR